MGDENQKFTIFGIPLREAATILVMAFAIGGAWSASQSGISNNKGKLEKLDKKIDSRVGDLKQKMDKVESRLHDEIRENRRLILKLLQRR